ncbi:uncharacterized protein VTP21DRAFT_1016 [Calcarisporiella thermophila]|uniref:uncharacterized protein n=1 Tax=Calcarisporiella thermophila TaxID=911321 RepID=UPI003742BA78
MFNFSKRPTVSSLTPTGQVMPGSERDRKHKRPAMYQQCMQHSCLERRQRASGSGGLCSWKGGGFWSGFTSLTSSSSSASTPTAFSAPINPQGLSSTKTKTAGTNGNDDEMKSNPPPTS